VSKATAPVRKHPLAKLLLAYTVIFAVLSVMVFYPFWSNGRIFVWSSDGATQHLKALMFYGVWLRDIAGALLSGAGLQLPTFSFGIGYGSDIVDTLSYYVVGDPFAALAVFVPRKYTYVLYTGLVILRMYCSGLAFCAFVRYVRRVDGYSVLVGAVVYVFCGYALYTAVRHPYFVNPMIYFPLILLGVERILRERKPWVFVFAIWLSVISNFYFFYMLFVLMALYIVMRLVVLHHDDGVRAAFSDLARLVGYGLLGVLPACVVFIPTVLYFLQSSRSDAQINVPFLYQPSYYAKMLVSFIAYKIPGSYTIMAFGATGLVGVVSLFMERRKNGQVKFAFIVATIFLCVPFFGDALNGFAYIANRWCWAYAFLISFVVAIRWKHVRTMSRRQAVIAATIAVVYEALAIGLNVGQFGDELLVIISLAVYLSILLLLVPAITGFGRAVRGRQRVLLNGGLTVVVCGGILINSLLLYSSVGEGYAKDFLRTSQVNAQTLSTEAKAIASLDNTDFFRYSARRDSKTVNAGMLEGISATNTFWSMGNANVLEYCLALAIDTTGSAPHAMHDLNGLTFPAQLAGAKYFVAGEQDLTLYGYGLPVASASVSGNEVTVYETSDYMPFGYAYNQVMSEEEFMDLDPEKRREALMQACVVGDLTYAGFPSASLEFTSEEMPFEITCSDGVQYADGQFVVKKKDAVVTLAFNGLPNAETCIEFRDLEFDSVASTSKAVVTFTYEGGFASSADMYCIAPSSNYYIHRPWRTICVGYSSSPAVQATISFPQKGTYSFSEIKVVSQRMDNDSKYVRALTQDTLQNVDMHYLSNRSAATNYVTGSISIDEPIILCTQIPYSNGWSVKIDGQPAELLQTNIMYCGVYLQPGYHEIEFEYETPGLRESTWLAVSGIALIIITAIVRTRWWLVRKYK